MGEKNQQGQIQWLRWNSAIECPFLTQYSFLLVTNTSPRSLWLGVAIHFYWKFIKWNWFLGKWLETNRNIRMYNFPGNRLGHFYLLFLVQLEFWVWSLQISYLFYILRGWLLANSWSPLRMLVFIHQNFFIYECYCLRPYVTWKSKRSKSQSKILFSLVICTSFFFFFFFQKIVQMKSEFDFEFKLNIDK